MNLLEAKGVSKYFGGVAAVKDVNLMLQGGEIYGLIGPNGAGKTTLFNCIAGYYPLSEGSIIFNGQDISSKPAHTICRQGISRTFQLVKIFSDMTVQENVLVAALSKTNNIKRARAEALEVLKFVGLSDLQDMPASSLTLINRKFVDLASALASKPKLLMLDELIAGLTLTEVQEALKLIYRIQDLGITIVLIEHVMEVIMPICHRVMVLNYGVKIAEDKPEHIIKNEEVIKAYLGDKYHVKNN